MMRRSARCGMGSALLLACLAGPVSLGQPQTAPPPNPSAGSSSVSGGPTLAQGMAALKDNQAREALNDFQRVLVSDPNNVAATLLASTAAVELFQGPLAVQYAEKAEKLDPRNWKIHTTLVAAYAAAGMKQQRDHERALLRDLHTNRCPRCAPRHRVSRRDVSSGSGSRRRHRVLRAGRPLPHLLSLPRAPAQRQARLAKSTCSATISIRSRGPRRIPPKPRHGDRQFQITGQGDDDNTVDYRMFSGKPDYDNVRVMVVEALRSHPIAGAR